jgi:ketosteroid isomerase-like protein
MKDQIFMKYTLIKITLTVLVIATFAITLGATLGSAAFATTQEKELRAANDQFYVALNAMFVGNLEPMNAIWLHQDGITDLGPFGDRLVGWKQVSAEFKKEAQMKLGGRVVVKGVLATVGSDMGYIVCMEEGENMSAVGKSVRVRHRATNIFKRNGNRWRLVHHHTDLSPELQQATQ